MGDKVGELLSQISPLAERQQWNPDFCGDIDLRIARDGSWFYQGTPITRPAMVRLFANVLRREGTNYFLVTPVEKLGIKVDDAPFVAVSLAVQGQGREQLLRFVTNVGDEVELDATHPLHVRVDGQTQEPSPYIQVRDGLQALIQRHVFYQLLELAEEFDRDGQPWLGLWSGGVFFSIGALQ